ncbi:MAG: VWA domain-containing protein [Acidobacteria bacterium]|nr:VWA domain-containing protein [Acidobacteriota bacterium]
MRQILALLLLSAVLLPGQEQNLQEPNVDEALTISDDPDLINFRTEINMVSLPVVVRGPKGEYVNGLEKSDFTIWDNEVQQKIDNFDVSFQPISMVICIQTSDRVEGMVDRVKGMAVLFTDAVLGEFGETALISFDSRLKLLSEFTGDTKEVEKALNSFRIGAGGIRVSDAVYEAIRMLNRRPENHKRVIVVIAEGQDNGSKISLGETMRTAQLYNIMVYPIYLSTLKARLKNPPPVPGGPFPPGINPLPTTPGTVSTPTTYQQSHNNATPNMIPLVTDLIIGVKNLVFKDALAALSTATGGEHYKPMTDEGIEDAIVKIGEDLRSQYLLSYQPNNLNSQGIYHRVEVQVPYTNAKVRTRPGYFYGPRPVADGEDAP